MKKNKLATIQKARNLRKKMTEAEKTLWRYLSNKGMCGIKFRRQHPINGFVFDFYCPARKLAIELDGMIHERQKKYDTARQQLFEDKGINFLRFKNNEVLSDIDYVLKIINNKLFPSPHCGEGCPDEIGTG